MTKRQVRGIKRGPDERPEHPCRGLIRKKKGTAMLLSPFVGNDVSSGYYGRDNL